MALTASLLGVVVSSPAGAWAPTSKSRPVLFLHGYDPTDPAQTDCGAEFNQMMGQLRTDGFTGSFVRVGYYAADTNCDANLFAAGTYQNRDSWKAIAKAFSWFVWNNYSRFNVMVDVVGYSMGGLIARGALHGARLREAGFSPELNVGGAVTLGTPHNGSPLGNACFWGQCAALDKDHADMVWLRGDCNPQGWFGTTWTVFGSNNDAVVPWASAISMCTFIDHKIVVENVFHADSPNYTHSVAVINQASNALGVAPMPFKSGLNSAKCMDVRNGSAAPGTAAQIWSCNGTPAQVWTRAERGIWTTIQAVGRCLDRSGGSLAAGTKVQLWPCNGTSAQWWLRTSANTITAGNNMCLDVPAGIATDGKQLQLWPCNGASAQVWN